MKNKRFAVMALAFLWIACWECAAQGATLEVGRVDQHGVAQRWVPAGVFRMGTSESEAAVLRRDSLAPAWYSYTLPHEVPSREITISQGYWIDTFEVTNAAFQDFVDHAGYSNPSYWSAAGWKWVKKQGTRRPLSAIGGPDLPRNNVTWYEAEAYANWRGGRLPTEAQWEYAARGPESRVYPWGNEFRSEACNIVRATSAKQVGSFPLGASWVGAQDMAGNVMEWVQDWFEVDLSKLGQLTDPTGPATGITKAQKGGWFGSSPLNGRAAYAHYSDPPEYSDRHIGFRIVLLQ